MATLAQRTQAVAERVDSLETILTRFMARTDESMARMDESMARTHNAVTRLERIVEHFVQEGARTREEAERAREEAERERREMNRRRRELAIKMGTVVEDIVAPSVRRWAREVFDCGDMVFFGMHQTVARKDDRSRMREFEALYVGTRAVLLNETNTSPRSEDVRAFVEFLHSGEFSRYFPQHRKLPIVPAFSSLSIPEELVSYLTRHGIYALAMGDEAMQVLNLEAVRSRQTAP